MVEADTGTHGHQAGQRALSSDFCSMHEARLGVSSPEDRLWLYYNARSMAGLTLGLCLLVPVC